MRCLSYRHVGRVSADSVVSIVRHCWPIRVKVNQWKLNIESVPGLRNRRVNKLDY
jgi:hypothetical protein